MALVTASTSSAAASGKLLPFVLFSSHNLFWQIMAQYSIEISRKQRKRGKMGKIQKFKQKNGISNGSRRGGAESLNEVKATLPKVSNPIFCAKAKNTEVKRKSSGGANLFAEAGTCFSPGRLTLIFK